MPLRPFLGIDSRFPRTGEDFWEGNSRVFRVCGSSGGSVGAKLCVSLVQSSGIYIGGRSCAVGRHADPYAGFYINVSQAQK